MRGAAGVRPTAAMAVWQERRSAGRGERERSVGLGGHGVARRPGHVPRVSRSELPTPAYPFGRRKLHKWM